jgi:hypothetical protein
MKPQPNQHQILRYSILVLVAVLASRPQPQTKADQSRFSPVSFHIGWYGGVAATPSINGLKLERDAGADIAIIYIPKDRTGEETRTFLEKAKSSQIKVFLQIPREWIGDFKAKIYNPDYASINKFIDLYKNHTALYGWYLFDEPEFQQFPSPQQAQNLYERIRAMDSNHSVASAFGNSYCWNYGGLRGNSHVQDYILSADLILFDVYPIFNQDELKPYSTDAVKEYHRLEDVPYMIDNCSNFIKNHHTAEFAGFIPVLQAFKWGGPNNNRYPTYLELRYMAYASLVRDSQGIILWNNYWDAGTPDREQFNQFVAYPVTREINALKEVALNGIYKDPQVLLDKPISGPSTALTRDSYLYGIAYKFGRYKDSQYLIVVNESRQTQQDVTFSLPSSVDSETAVTLFDGYTVTNGVISYKSRRIPLKEINFGQKQLTDTFAPYEVHIYLLGSGEI